MALQVWGWFGLGLRLVPVRFGLGQDIANIKSWFDTPLKNKVHQPAARPNIQHFHFFVEGFLNQVVFAKITGVKNPNLSHIYFHSLNVEMTKLPR